MSKKRTNKVDSNEDNDLETGENNSSGFDITDELYLGDENSTDENSLNKKGTLVSIEDEKPEDQNFSKNCDSENDITEDKISKSSTQTESANPTSDINSETEVNAETDTDHVGQGILVSTELEVLPGQLEFNEIEGELGKRIKIIDIFDALLFSSNSPIPVSQFQDALQDTIALNKKEVKGLLDQLKDKLNREKRPYELVEVFGGYQLKSLSLYSHWIKKVRNVQRNERLSKSALETLAIVAYKQPITRAEIEEIRGVNIDGVMKVLLEKTLIFASGKKDIPGKPWLYSTTKNFLGQFGLKSIQELPPLSELRLN